MIPASKLIEKVKFFLKAKQKEIFEFLDDDFLPFACLLDQETCITKDGNLCQVVEFHLEDYRLNSETGLRLKLQECLSRLEDIKTSFWIQTVKKKTSSTDSDDRLGVNKFFFDRLAKEYKKKELLLNNNSIVLCVSIFRKGVDFSPRSRFFINLILPFNVAHKHWSYLEKEKAEISAISKKIKEEMSHYSPKILSTFEVGGKKYSELVNFFGYLSNFKEEKYELLSAGISKIVNNSKFYFNNQDIRVKNADGGRKFISVFSLKEKPIIGIKMLADVLSIPCEIIISEAVRFAPKDNILKSFKKQLLTFKSSNDDNFLKKTGLDFLEDPSTKLFAKSNLSFIFIAESESDNQIIANFIDQKFRKYGLVAVREDISSQRVFLSLFPGNHKFIIRDVVHSVKEIAIFSYSYTPSLPQMNIFIEESFVCKFSTLKGNPFILGFLKDDKNITIAGQRGSGKTVLANFIASQFKLKMPNANIYTIEIANKSSTFYSAIGGKHYTVSLNKAENSAFFNPFSLFNGDDERALKIDYIKSFLNFLIESSNIVMTSDILNFVNKVSIDIASDENKNMAFYEIRRYFFDSIAEKELERWHSIGVNYYLFDNKKDCLDGMGDVGFFLDYTIQKNEYIMGAVLNHIVSQILQKAKKNKNGGYSIVVIDEPFVLFRHNYFKEQFSMLIAEANKYNVCFVFKVEDYMAKLRTVNSFNVVNKCQTQIHFGFRNIDNEYTEIFNLQKHEKLAIQSLGRLKYNSIFKQKNSTLSFYFNLMPFQQTIKILSDTKDTRDEIIKITEEIQTDDFDKILSVFYGDFVPIKDESLMFNIKAELEAMSRAEEILQ